MVQHILNLNRPAAYVRQIPDSSSIHSEGSDYYVGGGGVVARYANPNGTPSGPGGVEFIANLQYGDPFPRAAIAALPNGLSYVKAGEAWLLAPIRNTAPVMLAEQVRGYGEYWVIKQTPYYIRSRSVKKPSVVTFNVPALSAKDGELQGADELVVYHETEKTSEKISIIIDIPLMAPWSGSLQSSSQVNAMVTKGHLAKGIVHEVEKVLDASNKVLVAYFNEVLIKEVSLEDLFLVDLVQRSKGTFQPTIALRVPPIPSLA